MLVVRHLKPGTIALTANPSLINLLPSFVTVALIKIRAGRLLQGAVKEISVGTAARDELHTRCNGYDIPLWSVVDLNEIRGCSRQISELVTIRNDVASEHGDCHPLICSLTFQVRHRGSAGRIVRDATRAQVVVPPNAQNLRFDQLHRLFRRSAGHHQHFVHVHLPSIVEISGYVADEAA